MLDEVNNDLIRKGEDLYFAFYARKADQSYRGRVTLRGLEDAAYQLHDYVQDKQLALVHGPEANLDVEFQGALLVKASRAG